MIWFILGIAYWAVCIAVTLAFFDEDADPSVGALQRDDLLARVLMLEAYNKMGNA